MTISLDELTGEERLAAWPCAARSSPPIRKAYAEAIDKAAGARTRKGPSVSRLWTRIRTCGAMLRAKLEAELAGQDSGAGQR